MKKLFLLLALLSAGLASAQVVPPGSATNPFNAGISVPGCTINAVVYIDASGNLACGGAPAPTYDATNIRLQVGTGSTTQQGWLLGYGASSGISQIWGTQVSPSTVNYTVQAGPSYTQIGGNTGSTTGTVYLNPSGTAAKVAVYGVAGKGMELSAGTATTAVQSLSTTQTWNNAAITFTGHKYTIIDTASAAAVSLHSQWLGGPAGATTLLGLSRVGNLFGSSLTLGNSVSAVSMSVGTGGLLYFWNVANTQLSGYWNGTTANPRFQVSSSGGYVWTDTAGDATATVDTILYRDAAATIQLGADVNGAAVNQTLKAHDGITGTDISGANLTLAGGRGTGAGTAGNLRVQTAVPVSTGTTAQALADRELFVGKPRSVADNTATTLFTITLGDDTDGGGIVDFCSMATSATTDRQKTCGQIAFSGVDVTAGAGGETCGAAITGTNNTSVSVGTLTVTAAATTGTDLCNIQITSDSSLNVAHLIRYSVRLHPSASTVVITPQ